MLDWLRLIRASGLLTIASNTLAAVVVALYFNSGLDPLLLARRLLQGNGADALWVVLASSLLYLSGMLWNDLADVDRDRILHPRRPLPSGRISLTAAYIAGAIVAVGALLVASQLEYGMATAGVVLSLALLYDFVTKGVPYLGSLNMAAIRFMHAIFALLLLGTDYLRMAMNSLIDVVGFGQGEGAGSQLPLVYPAVIGMYIFGLTLVSELESRRGYRGELVLGGLLMLSAVGLATSRLIGAHWIVELQQTGRYFALVGAFFFGIAVLAFLLWRVGKPWLDAVRTGRKALVGPTVGAGLSAIVLLDALVATAYHPAAGLVIIPLYVVLRITGRLIRMD
jgi:4-hydroxybenzoate polyprenyltransferase